MTDRVTSPEINWLAWDGKEHIPIKPRLFEHLSGVNITSWYPRINEKERYKEVMAMPFFKNGGKHK